MGQQAPDPDVELSFVDQKGPLDVLLQHKCREFECVASVMSRGLLFLVVKILLHAGPLPLHIGRLGSGRLPFPLTHLAASAKRPLRLMMTLHSRPSVPTVLSNLPNRAASLLNRGLLPGPSQMPGQLMLQLLAPAHAVSAGLFGGGVVVVVRLDGRDSGGGESEELEGLHLS